ncbi:hypothetical protein I3843_13G018300 [Carya illinoinensis]|uniref:Uncharacterized protein n=2 Tax=Carya illinoinensis TaxID=32201 RepID=A0A922AL97_CARIL|nr:hypothetical protein I3760_13G018700 [Carya illinoinensis]KAG6680043.1 hypothetical protein I3842_13G019800 [Carya illinoinensis]KAG7948662.1 hypothetical protein I3843_13G018300 [Carya illinoinensis]
MPAEQTDCHFMDKTVPGNEVPEELTRESLIAISYSLPDKDPDSKLPSETLNGENLVGGIESKREEKYRSELISISYTQSPDSGSQPVTPSELKG